MKYVPLALAAVFVLAGITAVVCRLLRGPSTEAREVARVACIYCVAEGPHEDWCMVSQANSSVSGRASVDEVLFSASLARMEDELDAITEGGYRLPGERAS